MKGDLVRSSRERSGGRGMNGCYCDNDGKEMAGAIRTGYAAEVEGLEGFKSTRVCLKKVY